MKKPPAEELVQYLRDTVDVFNRVRQIALSRNKTVRIKAIDSMAQIALARAKSTYEYARAGGYEALDITIQKNLFDPIADYLIEEVSK